VRTQMNTAKKMILSVVLMVLSLGNFPDVQAQPSDMAVGAFMGVVMGAVGTVVVKAIMDAFREKPIDQSGSIYRRNMRPKEGSGEECRNISLMLEVNQEALQIPDHIGSSEGKNALWIQQNSLLSQYRTKCNSTSAKYPF